MKNIPKVSIIVPVYNVEKYIDRCLDSLIHQTLKDIEIIIINDGSTDRSFEICEKYAEKDSRIKLYSKENEGLGLTRNYGIKRAAGTYIAFLDSDDYIDKDFYEKLYFNIKKMNNDIVFACIKTKFLDGSIGIGTIPFHKDITSAKNVMYSMLHVENIKEYNKNYMPICVWRSLYKKEIIEKYNIIFESERKFISEDILFNIDYLMHSKQASFVYDTYYYYCLNSNSLTTKYKPERFELAIVLYKEIINRLSKYGEYKKVKKGLYGFFLGYVRGAIKQEVFCMQKSKKEKYIRIKEILNNSYVQEALKQESNETFRRKTYDLLMKKKKIRCLYILTKLKG